MNMKRLIFLAAFALAVPALLPVPRQEAKNKAEGEETEITKKESQGNAAKPIVTPKAPWKSIKTFHTAANVPPEKWEKAEQQKAEFEDAKTSKIVAASGRESSIWLDRVAVFASLLAVIVSGIAAVYARSQVAVMKRGDRPWVFVSLTQDNDPQQAVDDGSPFELFFTLTNHGKTPAIVTEVTLSVHRPKTEAELIPRNDRIRAADRQAPYFLIAPGARITGEKGFSIFFTPDAIRKLLSYAGQNWRVYGLIGYKDSHGEPHVTKFCYAFRQEMPAIRPAGFYRYGEREDNEQT
jgi:hypothetical protein